MVDSPPGEAALAVEGVDRSQVGTWPAGLGTTSCAWRRPWEATKEPISRGLLPGRARSKEQRDGRTREGNAILVLSYGESPNARGIIGIRCVPWRLESLDTARFHHRGAHTFALARPFGRRDG